MVQPTSRTFSLDTSGIAGFFGGKEAVIAMSTVHFSTGRWLLGWYNTPGSYTIAQRYGRLAKGRLWRGLLGGDGSDPVVLFGMGGKKGSRFVAPESGTYLPATEYLAYLVSKRCQDMETSAPAILGRCRRTDTPVNVYVVHLQNVPPIRYPIASETAYLSIFLAILTVSANIAVCAVSAVYQQWYAFALILIGIAANGISCAVIGHGKLQLRHTLPSKGSPRGDGVIINERDMIVLIGDEGAVSFVTRGSFFLDYSSNSSKDSIPLYQTPSEQPNLNMIGVCALLLTMQFVLQLLLIPQSSLFGQILFLVSLGVSWAYNTYLASLDREKIQIDVISRCLDLRQEDKHVLKYDLARWTGAAVFVAQVLEPSNCRGLLDHIIPNKTETWDKFKEEIASQLGGLPKNVVPAPREQVVDPLMEDLRIDAEYAREVYLRYLKDRPKVTQGTGKEGA